MYYIEAAERNLKKIFEIAKEKEDIELAKTVVLITTALKLAKFEDQGFICGECGMAILEEMAEVTHGVCHCKH